MDNFQESEVQNISRTNGVAWNDTETNGCLAKRNYNIECHTSYNPIIVFKGYYIWWCQTHHQPHPWCELAKERLSNIRRERPIMRKSEDKHLKHNYLVKSILWSLFGLFIGLSIIALAMYLGTTYPTTPSNILDVIVITGLAIIIVSIVYPIH